ncbi:thioredoxin-like domain-containing protein [Bacteroides caecigallinarum]|uniref:thioredoxin-like domain-containing protein n=1 Tax=Bacteroides caecigallinarum TaxID=1411144 RepID=UPI001F46AAE1|nr:thioredoxin-like domain-containing protein [Bacteroides caecigallinarum]MCF2551385.1 DUF4369 domain-containing protein [Bacteroides caecigallinarum]
MRILYKAIFLYTLIVLTSCGGSDKFILNGELINKDEKNIYAVFDDPIAKIDTISLKEGKFEYSFIPDTITLIRLVNDSGLYVPIFADKGWKVNFNGSFSMPEISGNGPNKELQDFRKSISNKDTANIISAAKDFILTNRESYASAYLFNQYFIQRPNPDMSELDEIITQMDGHIKDCRIVDIIQKTLSENKDKKTEYINYFSCRNSKGEYVSWSSKNEQYTLINIWASWDEQSNTVRDSLYSEIKSLPKEDFRVLNISIDFDKNEWKRYCKEENEQWIETCDFEGWQNTIVKQMNVSRLPYNILVTKNRKIITSNIYGKELTEKDKNLIQENKKKK